MGLTNLDTTRLLPFDKDAIESGDPKELAAYLYKLVYELQIVLVGVLERVNTFTVAVQDDYIYMGYLDSTGNWPDGTVRFVKEDDDGYIALEKKISGTWSTVAQWQY